jgi:hypothetical protein
VRLGAFARQLSITLDQGLQNFFVTSRCALMKRQTPSSRCAREHGRWCVRSRSATHCEWRRRSLDETRRLARRIPQSCCRRSWTHCSAIADEFGVARFVNVDLRHRYNVAPSENVETIIRVGDERRLGPMRWGFVRTAAKDPKLAPINARAETLAASPMFRDAFRRHRCLVVADGFYEWRKDGRTKTPHLAARWLHAARRRRGGGVAQWSIRGGGELPALRRSNFTRRLSPRSRS